TSSTRTARRISSRSSGTAGTGRTWPNASTPSGPWTWTSLEPSSKRARGAVRGVRCEVKTLLPRTANREPRLEQPAAGGEVGEGDQQEDREPEESAQDHDLRQARAVPGVHEEEHDERRLECGDPQRDDRVPRPQVHTRNQGRGRRHDQQHDEHRDIDLDRNDMVLRNLSTVDCRLSTHFRCLPIRYSNGNRKIHTMSTKCQYRPE